MKVLFEFLKLIIYAKKWKRFIICYYLNLLYSLILYFLSYIKFISIDCSLLLFPLKNKIIITLIIIT